MSDFTASLHHNPHPKPAPVKAQSTIFEAILDALGVVRKSRTLTQSDCKLVA